MPTDACVHFYECTRCHQTLTPKVGDCCVFCSYGSARCPPRQREGVPWRSAFSHCRTCAWSWRAVTVLTEPERSAHG